MGFFPNGKVAPRLPWEGEFAKGDFFWENAHHTGVFEDFRGRKGEEKTIDFFANPLFQLFLEGDLRKCEILRRGKPGMKRSEKAWKRRKKWEFSKIDFGKEEGKGFAKFFSFGFP